MARLPNPGGDDGTWGDVLNGYLQVAHNSDGTLRTIPVAQGGTGAGDAATARSNLGTISSSDSRLTDTRVPADGSVTNAKIASGAAIDIAKIAPGSNGQVLITSSGATAWGAASATDTNAVHKGDLVLNVKDYGALGDGTTDDTAAVQAAINAIPASGGAVFFPTGIYIINTTLTVTVAGTRFYGTGWDQSSLTTGSCLRANATITDVVNVSSAATTFKMDTMWIDANGKATNCLTIDCLNASLRDAYFRRPATNGVGVNITSGGTSIWITNVRVNGANQAGTTGIRLNATDSTLYGCKPVNVAVGIEYQNGASGGLCSGCHITPGSTIGVNCIWVSAACSNLGFFGNRFDNHGLGAGLEIDPSADCYGTNVVGNIFYQNVITDNTFPAIGIDTSTAMVYEVNIVANTVRSAASHNYSALLSAQKRDGTAATNTTRLNSYGVSAVNNTVFAHALYGTGTPLVSGGNLQSSDGTTWTAPADSSNPALAGDLSGTASAAVLVGGALTKPQRSKFSIVSGQVPRESFPFYSAANNIAPTGGVLLLALLPVVPGDVISNVGFVVGSTTATFGSSGFHWWTCIYDSTGANLLRQSADQTNAALNNSTAHMLALASSYTVPGGIDALLAGVMINVGTGGSPVTPTLRGATLNAAQVDSSTSLFTTSRIYAATNGTSLGATAPAGPLTLAASGNLVYIGAN